MMMVQPYDCRRRERERERDVEIKREQMDAFHQVKIDHSFVIIERVYSIPIMKTNAVCLLEYSIGFVLMECIPIHLCECESDVIIVITHPGQSGKNVSEHGIHCALLVSLLCKCMHMQHVCVCLCLRERECRTY